MTEPTPPPINLIRETFSHMGHHSGYDVLFDQITKRIPSRSTFIDHQTHVAIWRSIYWRLTKRDLLGLTPPLYHATERLQKKLLTGNYQNEIFHFAYWENNFRKLNNSGFSRKNTLIATQHQPAGWYKIHSIKPSKFFEPLNQLIVLTNHNREFFEEGLPGRVTFIPHGVDTNFFQPISNYKSEFRVVFVGQWLRDFNMLKKVIHLVCRNHSDIHFDLAIPKSKRTFDLMEIAGYPTVHFYEGLSDENLLSLYQNSSLLFLPLIDATANNGILEAMSTGLPILTTNFGGTLSYCKPEYSFVSDPDADFFYHTILRLYFDRDLGMMMGKKGREAAVSNFSWDKIADQVVELYQEIEERDN